MLVKRKISELRVSDLRIELDKRNLDSKGLKGTLLQRLQKAITDEGGDVNAIEIDVLMSPSPAGKKNSSRVKKPVEIALYNGDDIGSNQPNKTSISNEEKPVSLDDGEDKSIVTTSADGSSDTLKEELDQSKKKEEVEEFIPEKEPPSPPLEENCDPDPDDANEQSTDDVEHTDDKNDDDDVQEELHPVVEEIQYYETIEEQNDDNISTPAQDEEDPGSEHVDDDARLDHASGNPPLSDEEGLKVESVKCPETNLNTDDAESDDQWKDEEEKDVVAMEDDVLDMLDYDIEIPDQSNHVVHDDADEQTEEENKEEGEKREEMKVESDARECVGNATDEGEPKIKDSNTKTKPSSSSNETEKSSREGGSSPHQKSNGEKNSKNLWISGLSASTRASELKVAFSRYGKVVGAKVVTNARSPGSKCYGFVAMATVAAANKCILHLDKTEMHGRFITVEFTKNDPSASKKPPRSTSSNQSGDSKDGGGRSSQQSSEAEQKNTPTKDSSSSPAPKSSSSRRSSSSVVKESNSGITQSDKGSKQQESRPGSSTSALSKIRRVDDSRVGEKRSSKHLITRETSDKNPRDNIRTLSSRRDGRYTASNAAGSGKRIQSDEPFRKRPRPLDNRERKVVIDNKKGELSLRVNVSSAQNEKKTNVLHRISRSPIRNVRSSRPEERTTRKFESRHTAAQGPNRFRDRDRRDARDHIDNRRKIDTTRVTRPMAVTASIEREKLLLRKDREERNYLRQEREKLERQRRQLERDRQERERLEQERLKLEQERRRELEKIEREKEEMKRLQEINRYEQSQRQRAIKRMYDDSPRARYTGNSYDERVDVKRGDRDDRRKYEMESRDRRNTDMDHSFRDDVAGYRSRGGVSGVTRVTQDSSRQEKTNYHDIDRRNIAHNDTDARYNHSGGGRRVEKYGIKSTSEYGHDRRSGNDSSSQMTYREKDTVEDRKVISRERSRANHSDSYRRDDGMMMKKESGSSLARSPPPASRWKDTKALAPTGGSSSRARASDRDLREEIQRQGSGHGGGSSRKSGDAGRSDARHREESPVSRRNAPRSGSESLKTAPVSGKPIPTTGRSGMNAFQQSASWPWQQGERNDAAGLWHGGAALQAAGATVGRMLTPIAVPFTPMSASNPPQMAGATLLGHSMAPTFITADRTTTRPQDFKPMRRY